MQTPCMPSFAQVSPGGQSVWLVQMTRPLHALDAVHDADVRLVAQQTSPEEHVRVPHFGPPPLPLPDDQPAASAFHRTAFSRIRWISAS
jgi:hypothetical protein